ncbi:glycosyl transferase [Bryobacterales bacterium F-183]|nr:glycosyl transferase [Bryobacterales bacterium F-183]
MATLEQSVSDFEVIVVNDGSKDNTAEVLAALQVRYGTERFRVVTHPVNRGYGAALRSGFATATKDFVFYTDGDGQYDPAEITKLLTLLGPGVCWVNGFKTTRADSWHRIFIGTMYNLCARTLFRIKLRDIDCDFRLIRRNCLDVPALTATSGTICLEMVRQLETAGYRALETPVTHLPRLHGQSQFFRPIPLLRTFGHILALYWRIVVRPALPLREESRVATSE